MVEEPKLLETGHVRKTPREIVVKLWGNIKGMNRMQKSFVAFALVGAALVVGFATLLMDKDEYSKLLIDPAYAQDNFSVEATEIDSIGVESTTAFLIKSKSLVDAGLLEKNVSLLPEAEFDLKKIDDQNFRLTPKEPLQGKQVYNVRITSAYMVGEEKQERDYSWAFQVKDNFKVLQTLPRNEATSVPLDTGIEITFSQDNFVDYEGSVMIDPVTEGRFEKHGRTLVFVPNNPLTAGTIYTVTVGKGLALDGSDKRLDGDHVFRFETDENGAMRGSVSVFNFEKEFSEFSTATTPMFGFYEGESKSSEVPVTVYAFKSEEQFIAALRTREQVPYWARYSRDTFMVDASALDKVASAVLPVSKYSYQEFVTMPEALPRGYYLVEAKAHDLTRQAFFQVSDLAVYASITSTDTLVWVNDLKTKGGIAGASVKSLDGDKEATTGADGVATFATSSFFDLKSGDYEDRYIRVSKDGASSIVPLTISYEAPGDSSDNNYWYYFYTDRSLYKPTDTINFWGFVQAREGQELADKLTVRINKGDYWDYYNEPIIISQTETEVVNGTITGKIDLRNVTPGYYYMEYLSEGRVISQKYISIETYTKPAYNLEIAPEKSAIFAGENIVLSAKAEFFEGTPVADLGLTYAQDQQPEVSITTDGDGAAKITLPTTYSDCSQAAWCYYPGYSGISIRATAAEEGDISAQTQVQVFGAKVKASVDFTQEGSDKLKIVTKTKQIDIDKVNAGKGEDYMSEPAAGVAISAELTEIVYTQYEMGTYYDFIEKIARKQYGYHRSEVALGRYNGVTNDRGEHEYALPVSPDKSYKVKIIATDSDGRKDMITEYYYTSKYSDTSFDYYALRFKDKEKRDNPYFSVGERVETEFIKKDDVLTETGRKDFLYYRLRNGLVGYEVSDKAGYGFDFAEEYIPNINLEGVWFDGNSYHTSSTTWWYDSGFQVNFKKEDRQLEISLKTDKERYQPGEEVTINAEVKDGEGKGVASNLNLNLVDEAFYKLSNESANTLADLYNVRVGSGKLATYTSHKTPMGYSGAERGGCFTAGTRIKMADGSYKNIEEVAVGDEVLTFENERARKLVPAKVLETFEHRVREYLTINGSLEVTPEHRIFVNNGWEPIGMARLGDYMVDENGRRVVIESIERTEKIVKVYNLRIEGYATYIADGIYVHNDKGDGRENFVDNALFRSIVTGADGKAEVKFTLPDNITSWRVTAQTISDRVFAGSGTIKVAVSLPVFATNTFAEEYLASDKPTVKMNSYGDALTSGAAVTYRLNSSTLGIDNTVAGKAFQPQYISLPSLSEGTHKLTVSVQSGEHEDKMTEPIKVVKSRLVQRQQKFYRLAEGLKIEGSADGSTTVVMSDKNRGQFYDKLVGLEWSYGDRVDRKLSRVVAAQLLKEYFGEEDFSAEEFDGNVYQLSDGGIALLPYGDSDPELSAKIAAVASEHFDADSLTNYFFGIYNDKTATDEQMSLALFGLASLGEPVLVPAGHFAAIEEISIKSKIYAALTLYKLGDAEAARGIYRGLLEKYAEHLDPYVRLKVSDNQDEVLADTALMAILAGGIGDEYRDSLWNYAAENDGKDILTNMEELMYVRETLPNLKSGEVSFSVAAGEKKADVTLVKGDVYRMSLSPAELGSISFSNIKGDIGVTSVYDIPAAARKTSDYVGVNREYRVDGVKTDVFKENDLVQVVLSPSITDDAPGNDYQMTDLLPSGLRIVTNPYSRNHEYDPCTRYPFEIVGQKIKFYVGKSWYRNSACGNVFKYYARVISLGEYTAEPAAIESMGVASVKNYSSASKITIEK